MALGSAQKNSARCFFYLPQAAPLGVRTVAEKIREPFGSLIYQLTQISLRPASARLLLRRSEEPIKPILIDLDLAFVFITLARRPDESIVGRVLAFIDYVLPDALAFRSQL